MVVPFFFLFTLTSTMSIEVEGKGADKNSEISITKESIKFDSSYPDTERAEHIHIIITSTQKVDNVFLVRSGYWFKH